MKSYNFSVILYGVGLRILLKSPLNESNWSLTLAFAFSIVSIFSVHNFPSSQKGISNVSTLLGVKKARFVFYEIYFTIISLLKKNLFFYFVIVKISNLILETIKMKFKKIEMKLATINSGNLVVSIFKLII